MKALLTITAVLEAATGVTLVVAPSRVAMLLLGASLDGAAAQTVARIAGAALIALGVACWFARNSRPPRQDATSRAARGVIVAMLLYNAVVAALLVLGAARDGVRGVGLWPTAALHAALAAWCIAHLVQFSSSSHHQRSAERGKQSA